MQSMSTAWESYTLTAITITSNNAFLAIHSLDIDSLVTFEAAMIRGYKYTL